MLLTCRVHGILVLAAITAGAAACGGSGAVQARPAQVRLAAITRPPGLATAVLAGPAGVLAAKVASRLFTSAPVVVVADADRPGVMAMATARAQDAHAPLLLVSAKVAATSAAMRAEVRALSPRVVLALGMAGKALSALLPGIRVVINPALLPTTSAPAPVARVALLVRQGDSGASATAAVATALAAGAQVIAVRGSDPRADPAAIAELSATRPRQVLAIGSSFGPARRLAARVAVAETGGQLPGGGQVMFPMRRLVALYGYPGTPALGALGQQILSASIARARQLASAYRALSSVPVVPAFEILATVAEAIPGPDGTYSYESPIASLRPWVLRATQAGMYVVLDLQPGRASLLAQARHYQPLLTLPDVGLAIDAEWKLQPGQLPLQQVGSVSIGEVNSVAGWLAQLTARNHLPQKLLVLHQFRLSMINGEAALDTHHDDLAIVIHMDGQGVQADKEQTWKAITGAAPAGVFFGWKNFYANDHPMLTPQQTMANSPAPVMISYQ